GCNRDRPSAAVILVACVRLRTESRIDCKKDDPLQTAALDSEAERFALLPARDEQRMRLLDLVLELRDETFQAQAVRGLRITHPCNPLRNPIDHFASWAKILKRRLSAMLLANLYRRFHPRPYGPGT